jgi:translocator assembly and maintenance protein 41
MVDFMFAVTHAAHFHSINMQQFPSHYPLHARFFGSSYVSKIQEFGPGVWFNAYIPMKDVVRLQFGSCNNHSANELLATDNQIWCYNDRQSML